MGYLTDAVGNVETKMDSTETKIFYSVMSSLGVEMRKMFMKMMRKCKDVEASIMTAPVISDTVVFLGFTRPVEVDGRYNGGSPDVKAKYDEGTLNSTPSTGAH